MSKAFTREDNNSEDNSEDELPPMPGGKNFITPDGFKKLQNELQHLKFKERPEITKIIEWAAGNGDRSENGDYLYGKKRLREIDKRLRFLNKRLELAEVIDPLLRTGETEKIYFGATVTIIDEENQERIYSIVGVDEIDLEKRKISWLSPIGNALLKSANGDLVTFQSPRGVREVEVVKVEYKKID